MYPTEQLLSEKETIGQVKICPIKQLFKKRQLKSVELSYNSNYCLSFWSIYCLWETIQCVLWNNYIWNNSQRGLFKQFLLDNLLFVFSLIAWQPLYNKLYMVVPWWTIVLSLTDNCIICTHTIHHLLSGKKLSNSKRFFSFLQTTA